MKTLAALLVKLNSPLEICEIEVPKLQRGQVLVKVVYSGLCQSQLNEMRGLKGEDRFLPHTLGHEGTGVVLEVGDGVEKVKVDDHVVLSWLKGKGLDVPSSSYCLNGKKINSGAISTFLHTAVIAENRLVPIDKSLDLRQAALLGCALPTGFGVVKNEMDLKVGNSLAIFGVGGVGMSACLGAKYRGATTIIAVDIKRHKLALAKQLGATHCINAIIEDPVAVIKRITGGNGVDFAFESAGVGKAMEQAFASLNPKGLCVIAGNLQAGATIAIDPFALIQGKKILGTWGGNCAIDSDIPYYCDLVSNKKVDLNTLITHEVALENINELLHAQSSGTTLRGVIRCA